MRCFLLFWLLIASISPVVAQGLGGGVYIEDGGKCVGSVIVRNQALDGYGIAGGDGHVLNTTVVSNSELKRDTVHVSPGDVYCANGDIVTLGSYKKRGKKDAIGVVFWVNAEADAIYPKGAVLSLKETETYWGLNTSSVQIGNELVDAGIWDAPYAHLKDTACYGNTLRFYESDEGKDEYPAGAYCYDYRVTVQPPQLPLRWCMPVLMQLKRLFGVLPFVQPTLEYLAGEGAVLLKTGPLKEKCWYWSSDDHANRASYSPEAWRVNFMNGAIGKIAKESYSFVRPIFQY